MAKLETSYLGLKLKNPIIVSSCGFTATIDKLSRVAQAGAGAVVLKSLFEEQINGEALHLNAFDNDYPEAADYINNYVRENSIKTYIELIKSAKAVCNIPIIASINCIRGGEWVNFAKQIEQAGADALEANVFFLPTGKDQSAQSIESEYLSVVENITAATSIPVSIKISNHFTNPINIAKEISYRGAKGVVMFNRFYEPDINIDKMEVVASSVLSDHVEMRNTLRWLGMTSSQLPRLDLSASTGIHDGASVVKVLLAGASTAQICSVLYRRGDLVIGEMLAFLEQWMDKHNYQSVSEFVGKLNYNNAGHNVGYERAQFMKNFSSYKG